MEVLQLLPLARCEIGGAKRVSNDHSQNATHTLIGIEVKAAMTVQDSDFKGLRRLQRLAGKKMKLGILLHDGERVLPFGSGMLAVPYNFLWT